MPKSKALQTFEREFELLRVRYKERMITWEEFTQAGTEIFERLGPTLTESEVKALVHDKAKALMAAEAEQKGLQKELLDIEAELVARGASKVQ